MITHLTEEQITAMSEAFQIYRLCVPEAKAKIPEDFVAIMEECYNRVGGEVFTTAEDFHTKPISRECIEVLAYMCLFLK